MRDRGVIAFLFLCLPWAAACRGGSVAWSSADFSAFGYYEAALSGDPAYFDGSATVFIAYDTSGSGDVTINVQVGSIGVGGYDPYGTVSWDGYALSLAIAYQATTLYAYIPGPGISDPPGTIPDDLGGLSASGATIWGSSYYPDSFEVMATGATDPAPEPRSSVLMALGLAVLAGAIAWART